MSNFFSKRMHWGVVVGSAAILCSALLVGCSSTGKQSVRQGENPVLQVRWQRLVDEKGQTCGRCGSTEKAVEDAVRKLRRSLKPIHVDVVLQKTAINVAEFSKSPLSSNEIQIGDKSLEEWLQAKPGESPCSGPCGDSVCRTLTVDGTVYETIPAELIVRAGLLAGAQLSQSNPQNPWNPMTEWSPASPCCPPAGKQ